MLRIPLRLPIFTDSIFASHCRLAGEILESAVIMSVKAADEKAFERNFAQLRQYFHVGRCVRILADALLPAGLGCFPAQPCLSLVPPF